MMSGQFPVMCIAPLPDLFHEMGREEFCAESPEADAHFSVTRQIQEEKGQFRKKLFLIGFPIFFFQNAQRSEEAEYVNRC